MAPWLPPCSHVCLPDDPFGCCEMLVAERYHLSYTSMGDLGTMARIRWARLGHVQQEVSLASPCARG